jgi:hypothetical protein
MNAEERRYEEEQKSSGNGEPGESVSGSCPPLALFFSYPLFFLSAFIGGYSSS